MVDLIGAVAGQRILDAGCGAGHYASGLDERGASVLGLEGSSELVAMPEPDSVTGPRSTSTI